MKRATSIVVLLVLPLLLFADIKVNWMPQVGVGYTWDDSRYSGESLLFVPGVSGGVVGEVRVGDFFGVKAGLDAAQLVVRRNLGNLDTPIYDSVTGVTITINSMDTTVVFGAPVLAMAYLSFTELIEVYGGIGVTPSFATYNTRVFYNQENTKINEMSDYWGHYYTAFTADIGMHWTLGPGRLTAGFTYAYYNFWKTTISQNVKMYMGYLF